MDVRLAGYEKISMLILELDRNLVLGKIDAWVNEDK